MLFAGSVGGKVKISSQWCFCGFGDVGWRCVLCWWCFFLRCYCCRPVVRFCLVRSVRSRFKFSKLLASCAGAFPSSSLQLLVWRVLIWFDWFARCSSKRMWRYWCIVRDSGWLGVRCLALVPFHQCPRRMSLLFAVCWLSQRQGEDQ